jgi:alcohol dehydrogenase (quinone), cytochrome c subunit
MKRFLWHCVGVAILALVAVLTIALWPTATRRIAAAIGGSDSAALVERGRYIAPIGEASGRPPAKGLPPGAVWQATQSPA